MLLVIVVFNHTYASGGGHGTIESKSALFRQESTVTGKVTDESGVAFPGVNIVVKGTANGTVTNAEGNYSIDVPSGSTTLVFSFVGYSVQEVIIGGRAAIDVSLQPDVQSLDEVVVTALGIKKESKRLGYSATTVKTDELITNRTTNIMESLEGRVAGLNISPPAAGAGSSTQIRLRGQAAFAGPGVSNSPLIVVNGLPMDQDARNAEGSGQQRDRGDALQNINPDDIETMTVLKGATAAALYGSRAANGAIIITTKSGKKNQGIGVDFTSSFTTSHALNFLDEIAQTEYGAGQNGAKPLTQGDAQSQGQFGFGARLDGTPVMNFDGVMRPYSANPNQLDDFLRTGTNFTNTIGLSGGGEKGSFRVSFSNVDVKGLVPNNEYKKRIFNTGINHNFNKKLQLQLNVNYANEDNINPPQIGTQGDGAAAFFNRMSISTPLEAYRDNAKDPVSGAEYKTNGFLGTINNPYYPMQNGQYYHEVRNRFLGTATLRYQMTDWLYAQGRFNYDYNSAFSEWDRLNGTGATTLFNGDGTYRGTYNIQQDISTDINADFMVGANKQFGKFSVDASFGGNTWRSEWQRQEQNSSNFVVPDLYSIANGTIQNQGYLYSNRRVNSLYGWAEFGYNGMFYLNYTGRNDWFSVLNPQKNDKFYQSLSGSFIFSELLGNQSWLSYGKLRGSLAGVGSANGVNPYDGQLTYAINANQFNGQTLATVANVGGIAQAPNPNLQPFTVAEKEIGLEMRLFNNKVLFDIGAFDKVTTDQILNVQISNTSGYVQSKQNTASLKNSGLETLLEVTALESNGFKWVSSWNNTFLKTEVLDVGNESGTLLVLYFNGTGNEFLGELRYTEGMAMNQLYTRTYLRNDQGQILVTNAGQLRATNASTPGAELTNGFLPVGSSIPKFTGGWNNNFTYKNLSVGIFIDYKFGGTVLSSTHLNMLRQGHSILSLNGRQEGEAGLTFPGVYDDGSANTSVVTNLQGFYANYRNLQIGDPFTYKSDFVKLRNVSVTYNLTNMVQKVEALNFVKGLSVSASVRNLAILYKDLPGLDPEAMQSSGDTRAGYENSSLPTARSFNFSLNVKF